MGKTQLTRPEAEAWRDLHRKLAKTKTRRDAARIAAMVPPPNARRFYANLRHFLRALNPPRVATRSELYVYRKLRNRYTTKEP